MVTPDDLIAHLRQTTTPIASLEADALTVRLSASHPHAIDVALDLATGTPPDVGWCCVNETAFLAVGSRPDRRPLTLAFVSPADDPFLVAIARAGRLILVVEGTIPVTVPLGRNAREALSPFLHAQGWVA